MVNNRKEAGSQTDPRIAVVDNICNVEETEKPFGKRWHQEVIVLQAEHLAALSEGKVVAVDVCEEYVVFLKLDARVAVRLRELGHGG
ncbi:MAG TPA: hypothetical protein VLK32_07930 [Bacillota bacterium]|nr:hypothetical protein [Bacillota bacterium]